MYSVRIKTQIRNETTEVKTCPSFGFKHTFAATIQTFFSQNGFYLQFLGTFWHFFWSLAVPGTQTIFKKPIRCSDLPIGSVNANCIVKNRIPFGFSNMADKSEHLTLKKKSYFQPQNLSVRS